MTAFRAVILVEGLLLTGAERSFVKREATAVSHGVEDDGEGGRRKLAR